MTTVTDAPAIEQAQKTYRCVNCGHENTEEDTWFEWITTRLYTDGDGRYWKDGFVRHQCSSVLACSDRIIAEQVTA